MKIQAKNKNIKSMKLCVPFDGVITIDEKGMADVSAKCAAELVKNTNDWGYEGKISAETEKPAENPVEVEKKTAEKETEESVEEFEVKEEEDAEEEDSDGKGEITAESLNLLKVDELRAMCKEGGYPKKEYKDLDKSKLIKYILNKIEK